ncbi:hypothetical protein ACOSP7_032033 [Xanthoceras sorbifolium]
MRLGLPKFRRRRRFPSSSQPRLVFFFMAGGVDSTAQRRRVQRQRSLSRRNEAGSSEVSTSETIPVEQPTTLTDADGGPEKWSYKHAPEKWFVARVNIYLPYQRIGHLIGRSQQR